MDDLQNLRAKGEAFLKGIRMGYKSLVFCCTCGSPNVDQNSVSQLKCYTCGNVSYWDSYSFSIYREGVTSDISDAFIRGHGSGHTTVWHQQLDAALRDFIDAAVGSSMPGQSRGGHRPTTLTELRQAWEQCKERIDRLVDHPAKDE